MYGDGRGGCLKIVIAHFPGTCLTLWLGWLVASLLKHGVLLMQDSIAGVRTLGVCDACRVAALEVLGSHLVTKEEACRVTKVAART